MCLNYLSIDELIDSLDDTTCLSHKKKKQKGNRLLKFKPISNSMKSNEIYNVFSLICYPRRFLTADAQKLEDFNQIADWEPIWAYMYNIQPGLVDLVLLTNCMLP